MSSPVLSTLQIVTHLLTDFPDEIGVPLKTGIRSLHSLAKNPWKALDS